MKCYAPFLMLSSILKLDAVIEQRVAIKPCFSFVTLNIFTQQYRMRRQGSRNGCLVTIDQSSFHPILVNFFKNQLNKVLGFFLVNDINFRFWKDVGTTDAICKLNKHTNGSCLYSIFINLSKAFDCINYKVLQNVMKTLGFAPNVI